MEGFHQMVEIGECGLERVDRRVERMLWFRGGRRKGEGAFGSGEMGEKKKERVGIVGWTVKWEDTRWRKARGGEGRCLVGAIGRGHVVRRGRAGDRSPPL